MNSLGLVPPFRIEVLEGTVRIVDRVNVVAAQIATAEDPDRRRETNRMSRESAVAAAKIMARALSDVIERDLLRPALDGAPQATRTVARK